MMASRSKDKHTIHKVTLTLRCQPTMLWIMDAGHSLAISSHWCNVPDNSRCDGGATLRTLLHLLSIRQEIFTWARRWARMFQSSVHLHCVIVNVCSRLLYYCDIKEASRSFVFSGLNCKLLTRRSNNAIEFVNSFSHLDHLASTL